jgi:hypothetical protein
MLSDTVLLALVDAILNSPPNMKFSPTKALYPIAVPNEPLELSVFPKPAKSPL